MSAGVLLQQMPGQAMDEDDWNRLFDSVDVSRLFSDNVVTGPESVQ